MFEPVLIRPDQHLYRYKSVVANFHWNEFRAEHLVNITAVCESTVKDFRNMSSVIIMRGDLNIDLSNDMRKAASNLVTKFDAFNLGQAIVIEADGFRASMARSVITGINLLARAKSRQRVFQSPKEGLSWLCGVDGQPADVRDQFATIWPSLEELVTTLRR